MRFSGPCGAMIVVCGVGIAALVVACEGSLADTSATESNVASSTTDPPRRHSADGGGSTGAERTEVTVGKPWSIVAGQPLGGGDAASCGGNQPEVPLCDWAQQRTAVLVASIVSVAPTFSPYSPQWPIGVVITDEPCSHPNVLTGLKIRVTPHEYAYGQGPDGEFDVHLGFRHLQAHWYPRPMGVGTPDDWELKWEGLLPGADPPAMPGTTVMLALTKDPFLGLWTVMWEPIRVFDELGLVQVPHLAGVGCPGGVVELKTAGLSWGDFVERLGDCAPPPAWTPAPFASGDTIVHATNAYSAHCPNPPDNPPPSICITTHDCIKEGCPADGCPCVNSYCEFP